MKAFKTAILLLSLISFFASCTSSRPLTTPDPVQIPATSAPQWMSQAVSLRLLNCPIGENIPLRRVGNPVFNERRTRWEIAYTADFPCSTRAVNRKGEHILIFSWDPSTGEVIIGDDAYKWQPGQTEPVYIPGWWAQEMTVNWSK